MSLHVHVWDSANGTACGACGEYHPSVYRCSFDSCDYRMWDAAYGDIEDHWRSHMAGESKWIRPESRQSAEANARFLLGTTDPYHRGYEAGRRDAERDALLVVAAMVELAGGEIRLPRKFLVSTVGDIIVHDDPATMDRVYRLRLPWDVR